MQPSAAFLRGLNPLLPAGPAPVPGPAAAWASTGARGSRHPHSQPPFLWPAGGFRQAQGSQAPAQPRQGCAGTPGLCFVPCPALALVHHPVVMCTPPVPPRLPAATSSSGETAQERSAKLAQGYSQDPETGRWLKHGPALLAAAANDRCIFGCAGRACHWAALRARPLLTVALHASGLQGAARRSRPV